jgi:uncharacterized membrane protein HdeD (DUF308 family)
MRKLKEQNPLVLALAIIGVCALVYGGWAIYQRHTAEQQTQTFFGSPAQIPGIANALKATPQPPPQ